MQHLANVMHDLPIGCGGHLWVGVVIGGIILALFEWANRRYPLRTTAVRG